MKETQYISSDFLTPRDAWDKLSIEEQAAMMKAAVSEGILDLGTIRQKYNEFAEGGHVYDGESEDTQQMTVQRTPHVDLAISNPWLYNKLHPSEKKEEPYEPTTFAGRVAQIAGAGELGQKYVDYSSSVIQQVPGIGLVPSALDLGYDVNRMYHNPSTTTAKDVALDAASLLPALRKTLKGWWMKGNSGSFITETGQVFNNPRVASSLEVMLQPYRTAVNTGIYAGRATDFLDDSKAYLKDMYNDSPVGKHFPIKAYGGPLVEAAMNEYMHGGKIHIKPENRGKFTRLKERTGHSATWFKEHGTPAQKKMATFALNARHWKHGLGGNLFEDGGKPNIFRRPDGTYFYQADPDSEEIIVTPLMTSLGDESQWTYIDEVGKHYTPQRTITQGEVLQGEEPSILDNVFLTSNTNYTNPILGAPARWKYSWTNDTNPVKALWNSPLVMANPYLLGVKTISNLAGEEGIPKTVKLYQNSDGTDNAQWLWQRSLAGDLLESTMLFPAAIEGYELGNRTIQGGKRFIQNVGDRYQGMKDAANFRTYKTIRPKDSAADITNYIWLQRQGNIASDRAMLPATNGSSGLRDASGSYYHQTTTKGGNQTINVHLGGTSTGDKPWDLKPMEPSRVRWLNEYLETAPQGTIFGEIGGTKNYAEQYANVKPNWLRATKDALLGKNEYNPYWGDYEESLIARIAGAGEDNEVIDFYSNLLNNNNPLSADSYKMMLDLARKGKYSLRYDSAPMGLFNSQGVRQRDFYNSLLELNPEDKVEAINTWINNINPKARPAYLKDGEVIIPRPLLLKNTPSKNTWLRKNK